MLCLLESPRVPDLQWQTASGRAYGSSGGLSAGCSTDRAPVLVHVWLMRTRNKLLPSYKSCSEGRVKVGETLILLAGQMGGGFSIYRSVLWVNSLMPNASV